MNRTNSTELIKTLFKMAYNQNKYEVNWCIAIINAIICECMEESVIAIFKGFLESGVLPW